jgi:hypothetical protein
MTKPDEPAFVGIFDNTLQYIPGLTKREYFAGLAMQGLLAMTTNGDVTSKDVAALAVLDADALIAELAKQGSKA